MSFLCDREWMEDSVKKSFDLTVQITAVCNLSCPYCFARGTFGNGAKYISHEDLSKVVKFCTDNGLDTLRLTGGEPLLHPELPEFIRLLEEHKLKVHIFSNFTVPGVLQMLNAQKGSLSFLININDSAIYDELSWSILEQNIEYVIGEGHRVVLGYNIFELPINIGHIIELAEKYSINALRLSPANPIIGVDNRWLGRDSLDELGRNMGELVRQLRAKGIVPMLDCPIPLCIFPEEELAFLQEKALLSGGCSFGGLIGPELSISHCFVTQKAFEDKKLEAFATIEEMRRFIKRQLRALGKSCCIPSKCSQCSHFTSGSCCGGCWGLRVPQYQINKY